MRTVNYENLGIVVSGQVASGSTIYGPWHSGVGWAREATIIVLSDVYVWAVVQVRNGGLEAELDLSGVTGGAATAIAVALCRCESLRFGIRRVEAGPAQVTAAVELFA